MSCAKIRGDVPAVATDEKVRQAASVRMADLMETSDPVRGREKALDFLRIPK
jgi:hypothetical protein